MTISGKERLLLTIQRKVCRKKIDGWILEVMGNNYSTNSIKDLCSFIDLSANEFDSILIACTELSVMFDPEILSSKKAIVVDGVITLAEEILLRARISG
jgi:aspartate/glutamate racemase